MKKILGIVVLGLVSLLLNNCAPTVNESFSKHWGAKSNNKYGGSVRVDPMASTSFAEIKETADNYCQQQGSQYAKNIKKSTKGSAMSWYFYNFECYPAYENKLIAEKKRREEEQKKAEEEKKKIAEKPKKKKPKKITDENKVVPAGSGSGFIVSNAGHIITNHHVIDGCNLTKVHFKGSELEAKILAVDKVNDIAIIQANANPDNIFSVSNEDVSLLEDVIVAGYPLGKKVSSSIKTHKGVVTALAGAGDNYSNFQTDAAINQGNSGGPIINLKGNIVGIAVATWVQEGVQGVHFGIKSSTLKTFASANGLRFSTPNNRELSNKQLGQLITSGTVYLECHMTIAKIKKMIAEANNRKAFFSEYR